MANEALNLDRLRALGSWLDSRNSHFFSEIVEYVFSKVLKRYGIIPLGFPSSIVLLRTFGWWNNVLTEITHCIEPLGFEPPKIFLHITGTGTDEGRRPLWVKIRAHVQLLESQVLTFPHPWGSCHKDDLNCSHCVLVNLWCTLSALLPSLARICSTHFRRCPAQPSDLFWCLPWGPHIVFLSQPSFRWSLRSSCGIACVKNSS